MEFSHYSTTGFGQHVKHALAQKVFASRYISTENQNVNLRKDHMLYRNMYTYTYLRAARYFQGHVNSSIRLCLVRTLLWKTSGTPLSQKVIILSKVFKQRWIWMCVAVFRKFHALMLGTGQTGISYWALTGHSMASSPAHAAMDNKPRCLSHQCCQGNLTLTPRTSKKWFSHRQRPTRRPSHGSGLAIIRKLLIVFSGPLASDNISLDFPTTSVSICLLWTKLSFVSICLPNPTNDLKLP